MALTISGKDNRLNRTDFLRLGATSGFSATTAKNSVDQVLQNFALGLNEVSLSSLSDVGKEETAIAEQMLSLCKQRLDNFS